MQRTARPPRPKDFTGLPLIAAFESAKGIGLASSSKGGPGTNVGSLECAMLIR